MKSNLMALASFSLVQAGKLTEGTPKLELTTDPLGGKDAKVFQFPADWSRGAYPIGVHSHNDYWQVRFH